MAPITYAEMDKLHSNAAATRTCPHGNQEHVCPSSMCHLWLSAEIHEMDEDFDVLATMPEEEAASMVQYLRDTYPAFTIPAQYV